MSTHPSTLSKLPRMLVAAASILLIGLYFLPLWRIELIAPQYPEGLGMRIHLTTITGLYQPSDLDNINGLNHYIGMKEIHPDSIPELRIMPWVLAGIIGFGLLTALVARRALLWTWVVGFALTGLAGLADFWKWNYDYGHNLAPDAAIKVPGMAYQPPLIGQKTLLNFVATSWPDAGGILAGLAFGLGALALFLAVRASRTALRPRTVLPVAAAILALTLAGCRPAGPEPLALGERSCDYCRMTITDARYGAQAVTGTGKVHAFDSIECLAGYALAAAAGTTFWVADFEHPEHFVPAERARFVRGGPSSPMGLSLRAYPTTADTAVIVRDEETLLAWNEVLSLVREKERGTPDVGVAGHADHADHLEHAAAPARPAPRAAIEGARDADGAVIVSPTGAVRTVTEGLKLASRGGTVRVRPGVYREPTIVVERPVVLAGDAGAILDGQGAREIVLVVADSVTVRGFELRNSGSTYTEDRAALRVKEATDCLIADNRVTQGFFGIYLGDVERCRVERNVLRGVGDTESATGNGIHLWTVRDVVIADNDVRGHRDGVYFEFVQGATVARNHSEGNVRYGLHFMYSDDCRYEDNVFRRNGSGVAVMYTKTVAMRRNRFEDNWGAAAYGLLLKEISDPVLDGNVFARNTTGLVADGAVRIRATANEFEENGWAVRLMASTYEGRFHGNRFARNTFDVVANSVDGGADFTGNWWDEYRGHDLDRDGHGDLAHYPVRLFSVLVERAEPALVLLRSPFVRLVDAAERVAPVLTPATVVDVRPVMRREDAGPAALTSNRPPSAGVASR